MRADNPDMTLEAGDGDKATLSRTVTPRCVAMAGAATRRQVTVSGALAAVRQYAGESPVRPAVSGHGVAWSYRELAGEIDRWERVLRRCDGATLALALDNSPAWIVADLAAMAADIAVVPLPQFFSPAQRRHVLRDCGADLALASDAELSTLGVEAIPVGSDLSQPGGARLWWLRGGGKGDGLGRAGTASAESMRRAAKISYTSGTTGEPRGVCLSGAAMDAVAQSLVIATRELDLLRHLCLLPLATLLENVAGNHAPLIAGAEVIVPGLGEIGWYGAGGLDIGRLTRLISATGPDSVILVPEMLRGLLGAMHQGWAAPASLRFVAVGGGRVAPALLEEADRLGLPVFEGYGLTECASVVTLNTPAGRRRGSVGRPLAHASVRIDAGGEVCVAGPSVSGYLGDGVTEKREHATGDLGAFDADGFLYIHGRRRNVFINSYGRNVSPDWLEPEFLRHPAIGQIAIFGEARPWNVAIVTPRSGASAAAVEGAIAGTNADLPDYARVGAWIPANEPFGLGNGLLTSNGRVRRAAVWKTYKERIDALYRDDARRGALC